MVNHWIYTNRIGTIVHTAQFVLTNFSMKKICLKNIPEYEKREREKKNGGRISVCVVYGNRLQVIW